MGVLGLLERYRERPLGWGVYAAVGVAWFATIWVMGQAGEASVATRLFVGSAYMALLGLACTWNGLSCGALHCRVSGPAYILVAALGLFAGAGLFALGVDALYLLFGAVVAASFGLEWIVERKARAG